MTSARLISGVLMVSLVLGGCELSIGTKKTQKKKDNIARTYSRDKKLVSEVPMKDKMRHGVAKTYYTNGKVKLELPYVDDKREGTSRRYYESGLLYQETDYKDDQIHGVQKKYEEAGLMSEARYEDGKPCQGLVEYSDGKKRTNFPSIVIKVVDRIQTDGTYTLLLSVTEGALNAKFYVGELTKSGCLHYGLIPLPKGEKRNTGVIFYSLSPGQFYMEELNIIAEVETRKGNTWITQKTFPLSIEN